MHVFSHFSTTVYVYNLWYRLSMLIFLSLSTNEMVLTTGKQLFNFKESNGCNHMVNETLKLSIVLFYTQWLSLPPT